MLFSITHCYQTPAMKRKDICRTHGGLSRGPVTEEGKARCAAAKTIHGRETREKRAHRSTEMADL